MNEQNTPRDADLVELEAALGALAPKTSGLSRDDLMFLAGRQSGRARVREAALASLAGAMTLVAASLGVALWWTPSRPAGDFVPPHRDETIALKGDRRPTAPRAVVEIQSPDDPSSPATAQANYVAIRDLVIARGVDAWPSIAPTSSGVNESHEAPTRQRLLEQLLHESDASL